MSAEGFLYKYGRNIFRSDTPQEVRDSFYFNELLADVSLELDNKRLGRNNAFPRTRELATKINGQLEALNQNRLMRQSLFFPICAALIENFHERVEEREIDKPEIALKLTLFRNTLRDASILSTERTIELRDYCNSLFGRI
jgi:hypothetical protein